VFPDVTDKLANRPSASRGRKSARKGMGLAAALQNASLFSLCSRRELELVAKLAKTKYVPPNTKLVTEGETGETMFVLLHGGATVHKNGRKVAELGAGDVVGELALLSRGPRNATVTTNADTEVAVLGRRELYRLIDDVPGVSRKLLESLANRVRETDRKAFTC
jgi:CRP-like cAMP-binding protein